LFINRHNKKIITKCQKGIKNASNGLEDNFKRPLQQDLIISGVNNAEYIIKDILKFYKGGFENNKK